MSTLTQLPKAWATLQARAALAGLAVFRSDPADGPVRLFVQRGSAVHELRSIDDLEALAAHVAQPAG